MGTKMKIIVGFSVWLLIASTASAHTRSLQHAAPAGGPVIDIVADCGATENADVTEALKKAWTDACGRPEPTTVKVPVGVFTCGFIDFCGPCKAPITFQLDGTLKAPPDPAAFAEPKWVVFSDVEHLTICGTGTLDGQGQQAWASKEECKKTFSCKLLPYNLRLDGLKHTTVTGITSKDSKNFNINLCTCDNVTLSQVKVSTPAESINTDGIHISGSNAVSILDSQLACGDDCVSLGDGTTNLLVDKVTCSPGHGLSIGSLGRYKDEKPLTGIKFTNCILDNADNGARLKSWPGLEPNSVTDVLFEGLTMNNVSNPIIIDQEYCPYGNCKKGEPTKVKMSKIIFRNIKGTAACPEAVQLLCSVGMCENIELADVDLKYDGPKKENYSSICTNVKPTITGALNPPGPTCCGP